MQGFWVAPNKMSQQIQRQYRKTVDNALQGTWRYRTQNGLLWSKFTQRILSKSSHFSWALPAYHPHNLDPNFPPQSTTFQRFPQNQTFILVKNWQTNLSRGQQAFYDERAALSAPPHSKVYASQAATRHLGQISPRREMTKPLSFVTCGIVVLPLE